MVFGQALEALIERRTMDKQTKAGESMAEFADAMFIDPDGTEDEAATGPFRVGRGCEPMVELRFADVSRHDCSLCLGCILPRVPAI